MTNSSFGDADGSFLNETGGQPITVLSPTTGSTVTMKWSQRRIYVANASTLAALTFLLPKQVQDGQKVELAFQSAVTALTVHDGFGNAITGAPTAGAANAAVIMCFVNKTVGWVHWK